MTKITPLGTAREIAEALCSDAAVDDLTSRVRDAIKDVIVDQNMTYPEGWSGGWLVPDGDDAADAMLDEIAISAVAAMTKSDKPE